MQILENAIMKLRKPYGFLSNMAACNVAFDGVEYNSIEHAYQAARSLAPVYRTKVQMSQNPVWAKRMGKGAKTREDWSEVKVDVMLELLRAKFSAEKFRVKLLATGEAFIAEGNQHGDRFWGMVPDEQGELVGENWLGRLLMKVREEIRCAS